MKFIDLFSGIGGFRLALEKNNHKCVFSADFDKYSCDTYFKNFGEYPLIDIKTLSENEIPNHDILCAGFPCQPFSIAGKRRGFEDTRGTLFFDILRILKKKKPKIFILENVKGLVNHDKNKTFKIILESLSKKINNKLNIKNRNNLGYNVFWSVLNSKDYNIPQNRERVFIVGFKNPNINFQFPLKKKLTLKFSKLLENKPKNEKKISLLSSTYVMRHLKLHKNYNLIKNYQHLIANEVRKSRCNFHYSNISPCLTTKMGTGGNNVPYLVNKKRFLTLKECLRLQGFPSNYKLTKNYSEALKQIGNSVTVNVVDEIVKKINEVV